jgi:hypothetical protein
MSTQSREAVLVRFARGFSVVERRHVMYQYRRPPVPVPVEVVVEGRPDPTGGLWLPSTAVGEGADPGGDGEAEAAALPVDVADGAPDRTAEGGDAVCDCVFAGDGDPPGATLGETVGDGVSRVGEGVVLWPPEGPRATGRGWVANTAAPSATRPRIATIGTRPIRRSSGRSSRQLGQKPETGTVT